ncbi:MAG: hypothetical protein J7500_17700 [Sphingomonas sp.]|uniref:hypothetical protein n=1 Tax=Sphingomonas sp. TaxID=28214 RepID=UPI001B29B19E|nr:hypothetical protein [Sphingomonas sp.]MBO9624546.1 hypothetical protein [Sphingomonas sp.]
MTRRLFPGFVVRLTAVGERAEGGIFVHAKAQRREDAALPCERSRRASGSYCRSRGFQPLSRYQIPLRLCVNKKIEPPPPHPSV